MLITDGFIYRKILEGILGAQSHVVESIDSFAGGRYRDNKELAVFRNISPNHPCGILYERKG